MNFKNKNKKIINLGHVLMVIVENEKIMTLLFFKCNLLWAEPYIMQKFLNVLTNSI